MPVGMAKWEIAHFGLLICKQVRSINTIEYDLGNNSTVIDSECREKCIDFTMMIFFFTFG